MLAEDYYRKIQIIEDVIEDIVKFDDFKRAKELYDVIVKIKNQEKESLTIEQTQQLDSFLIISKWISFPFFNEKDIRELFFNYFHVALEIPAYDLKHKMKHYLLGIFPEENRDVFKEKIKRILDKNQVNLTRSLEGYGSASIENWIKYYTSKLGIGAVDRIRLQEFFTNDPNVGKLNEEEKRKVIDFFVFYEFLKYSSLTVEGYEGIIPVNTNQFQGFIYDGKLVKASRLEPRVERILRVVRGEKVYGESDRLGPPKTPEEKEIESLKYQEGQYKEGGLERLAIEEEIGEKRKLEDLKIEANKYPAGSLERMVVEEEIRKLGN